MCDFYTIETPPSSSSTSKDSIDESIALFQTKKRIKLIEQISNQMNSKHNEVSKTIFQLNLNIFYTHCLHVIKNINNNSIDKMMMMTHIKIYFLLLTLKGINERLNNESNTIQNISMIHYRKLFFSPR